MSSVPLGLGIAGCGAMGVYLLVSVPLLGVEARPRLRRRVERARRHDEWMHQAGLGDVAVQELIGVTVALGLLGGIVGFAMFGGVLTALGSAAFSASIPFASYRHRRQNRLALAQDAWPNMIDEIRILTGSAGRSIPQALFDVGLRGPVEMRPAFETAHREWLLSTDFSRTIVVLKQQLASPTADATCETLLVANEVGGADLDRRLAELAEDRRIDNQGRKDAAAKQAGVRFARRFVILVPLGMALAGMSLGDGRKAYSTLTGQVFVALGIALVVLCWAWSARMLRLPTEERVFSR